MICCTFSKADVLLLGLPDRSSLVRFMWPRKNIFRTLTLVFCSYTSHHITHSLPAESPSLFYYTWLKHVLYYALLLRWTLRTVAPSWLLHISRLREGISLKFLQCPPTQKLNFPRFLRACDRLSLCYIYFPITFGMPLVVAVVISHLYPYQLGLCFQRTPENVSSGHIWFLSNFPPHKTNYPPFQITTLHKKIRKNVLILLQQSIDSMDTKFFSILAITVANQIHVVRAHFAWKNRSLSTKNLCQPQMYRLLNYLDTKLGSFRDQDLFSHCWSDVTLWAFSLSINNV